MLKFFSLTPQATKGLLAEAVRLTKEAGITVTESHIVQSLLDAMQADATMHDTICAAVIDGRKQHMQEILSRYGTNYYRPKPRKSNGNNSKQNND